MTEEEVEQKYEWTKELLGILFKTKYYGENKC